MYCAPCASERLGFAESCAVCGARMERRPDDVLRAELSHVEWVLKEVPRWDGSRVPPVARSWIITRYRQQERVLNAALAERVEPAPLVVDEVVEVPTVHAERRPSFDSAQDSVEAGPESAPGPLRLQSPSGSSAQGEREVVPPPPPAALFEVDDDEPVTVDDQVVEEASLWHKSLKPFLSESVGWFIGGFLILVGTLYWVADAWSSMSGTLRSVTVFGFAAAWTLGFAAWGRFLSRREATQGAARVLGLIAAAVAPLPAIALGPIAHSSPVLFGVALAAWSAFTFFLSRRDVYVASASAATTAMMGLAPVVASPWLAALPLAAFLASARRRTAYAVLAPLYLFALFCVRVHVAAPVELATWAPIAAAALYAVAPRKSSHGIAVLLAQGALLVASIFGAAPAFFLTSVALFFTARSLVKQSTRFVFPAYAGAYLAFQTCGQLVPSQLKVLLAQLREALGYPASQALPAAWDAVYAAVFVVAAAVFAAVKLRGAAQRAVLTATAWASLIVGAMGLESVAHDARPALISAPIVAVLCLVLGSVFGRRLLSWAGAALSLCTAVALLFAGAGALPVATLALALAGVSVFQLAGHREAYSAGSGALALLGIGAAFMAPGGGGIAAVALASVAVLLVARNLGSRELMALAFFAPLFVLPKVALVFAPEFVAPALAVSGLVLAVAGRGGTHLQTARYPAWAAAAVAPLLCLGSPYLGVTLLICALALFVGPRAWAAHALGIVFTFAALLPLGHHAPLPFMTRDLAGALALLASIGASAVARKQRTWRPALVASLAIVLALTCGVSQQALWVSAATALLSSLALLPAIGVPLAVALAAGATFFNPLGLVAVGVATTALALAEPKLKGLAWPASLSALALAPLTLGMTAWTAHELLIPVACIVAASVLVWIRATRWSYFAVALPGLLLVPQLASAPVLHLWLAVLAVVALTRISQARDDDRAFQLSLSAGLALSGLGLWLTGSTHLLPFAVGLLLAAAQPAALRVAAAAVFALAVPGIAPLAAVVFLGIGLGARHSPRAARWILGDEQRGWTVTSAAIASIACAAYGVLLEPASLGAGLLLGGCLAAAAVLLGLRWTLSLAVLALAVPLSSATNLRLEDDLRTVITVFAAGTLAAISRLPEISAATLRRCAHVGRAFDGPLSTPLWLGAAVTYAVLVATGHAPLWAAVPLLVTGVAWEAAVAIALAALAVILHVPHVSLTLAGLGFSLAVGGALLEKRHAVGRVWHHAGWMLAALAVPFLPGLESPATVATLALGAGTLWTLAVRQRRHEWLAWTSTAVALHVALFFAGLKLGHGDPHALILPWCGLVSVVLAALAFQLRHTLQRYRFGLTALTFGLAELSGATLLLDGAWGREAVVGAVAVAVAVLALGRLVLDDDDGVAMWLLQAALAVGFVAFRWIGFNQPPDIFTATAALVFGAVLGGAARVLPATTAAVARSGAWLWPLVGLLAAPFDAPWVVAALLVAHAVHFGMLGRAQRRFALLSSVAFNAALGFAWLAAGLHHAQYLLVPVGLTALVLLRVFERDFAPLSLQRARAVAVTAIYAAAAFEPLAMPTPWTLWLCALICVLGVAAGIALRVRSYVFLGTGFLVTTVVASLTRYGLQQPRIGALLLSGLGLLIVGFMVLVTTRRSELLQQYQRARSMLAQWQG